MYELTIYSKLWTFFAITMFVIGVLTTIVCIGAASSGSWASLVLVPIIAFTFEAGHKAEKKHDEIMKMINEIKKG